MLSGLTLLLAALSGTPFEDTQGRFTLDLPAEWSFAPQPGETDGATFQRTLDGARVTFTVRVLPVSESTTVKKFMAKVAGSVDKEPGYQLLDQGTQRAVGLSWTRRRYQRSGGKNTGSLIVEDLFAVHQSRGYILRAEASADKFATFGADFSSLVKGLRFIGIDPNAPNPHPPELVGKWLMIDSEETVFLLNPDGTFDLDGNPGVWRVSGNAMRTRPLGGGEESFTWRIDQGQLEVFNEALGSPIRYRRADAAPVAEPPAPPLVGRWKATGHALEVQRDAKVVLDGEAGTYTEADGVLVLRLGKDKRKSVVSFVLEGNKLTLSDGPFGKGVVFARE